MARLPSFAVENKPNRSNTKPNKPNKSRALIHGQLGFSCLQLWPEACRTLRVIKSKWRRARLSWIGVWPIVGCTIVTKPSRGDDAGTRRDSTGEQAAETGEDSEHTSGEGDETKPADDTHQTTGSPPSSNGEDTTGRDAGDSLGATTSQGHQDGGEPTSAEQTAPSSEKPDFDCGAPDLNGAPVLRGVVTGNQTWSGTYIVEGELSVDGADVTIEPGTHFVMKADSLINFGGHGDGGTLKAEGTPDQPITFCGEESGRGYWGYVAVRDEITTNSKLANVFVRGGAVEQYAEILVQNLVIEDAGGFGMIADDFKAGSYGVFISGSEGADVSLLAPAAATRFPAESSLSTAVNIAFTRVTTEATLHDLGVPYRAGSIDVMEGGSLTIEAGLELEFAPDTKFTYGAYADAATVLIQGTGDDPVVMRGQELEVGFWRGLAVESTVLTNSKIEHLVIEHAGGEDVSAFAVSAPIEVSHLTLRNNASPAYISETGVKATSTGWSITGSAASPLYVQAPALLALPKDSHYTGNGNDVITVVGDRISTSGTIGAQDVPYQIVDGLLVTASAVVTLEPGCTFLMNPDTVLDVGVYNSESTLVAVGTQAKPIVFKGAEPGAGFWSGARIRPTASTNSVLEWVEFHDGGGEVLDAALQLELVLPVSNCTFTESAGWGLLKDDADATDYEAQNTFESNANGAVGSL